MKFAKTATAAGNATMRPYFGKRGAELAEVLHAVVCHHGTQPLLELEATDQGIALGQLAAAVGRPVVLLSAPPPPTGGTCKGTWFRDPDVAATPEEPIEAEGLLRGTVIVLLLLPSSSSSGPSFYNWLRPRALRRARPSGAEVRRLARRGGVKRFRGDVQGATVGILRTWLQRLLGHCVALTDLKRKRCVTSNIVLEALRYTNNGSRLYR